MGSRHAYLVATVAAISGLLLGFDTAVINGALIFLRRELSLSAGETELATSSLLVGCAAGAAVAGWLADRSGRKRILLIFKEQVGGQSDSAAIGANVAIGSVSFVEIERSW